MQELARNAHHIHAHTSGSEWRTRVWDSCHLRWQLKAITASIEKESVCMCQSVHLQHYLCKHTRPQPRRTFTYRSFHTCPNYPPWNSYAYAHPPSFLAQAHTHLQLCRLSPSKRQSRLPDVRTRTPIRTHTEKRTHIPHPRTPRKGHIWSKNTCACFRFRLLRMKVKK